MIRPSTSRGSEVDRVRADFEKHGPPETDYYINAFLCFDAPVGFQNGDFGTRRYVACLGVEESFVDGSFWHSTSILVDTLEVSSCF